MIEQANTTDIEGAPSLPAIGAVIAEKYRIDSVVGTGGMGVVLCATHLGLGQKVAIKVLTVPEDDARLDEARGRFIREGRATAALLSDHVVRVYDVGTLENGAPFMVMELLRGQDLAATLQRGGPLSVEFACDCVRQAAEAIACAHEQSIIHRDLKPSNLFLTQRSDGSALIKVLDFGISKSTSAELQRVTSNLTLERSVLGTPLYMSPEQVRDAKNVDARTDIWSLGLILHELLSGTPAFEGTTLPGVCASIAADPPAALRLKRPAVPVELEAIVLKCLEKDPSKRFQTARELVELLTPWSGRGESGQRPPLRDAAARSAPLGFELGQLRDGSTVSVAPDTGTLASAVFTKSGSRAVLASTPSPSEVAATQKDGPPPPIATVTISSAGSADRAGKRLPLAFGAGLLVALSLLVWALRGTPPTPEAATQVSAASPAAPPKIAAVVSPPVQSPNFSLHIDSAPTGAQVYEGDALLGTTPLRINIEGAVMARAQRIFTVRKAGHLPYTVVQGPATKDVRVLAELSALPSAAPAPLPKRPAKQPAIPKTPAPASTSGSDIFMQR